MRNVLVNSFSLNMLTSLIPSSEEAPGAWPGLSISLKEVKASEVPDDCMSIIGHADTAHVVGSILGWDVPANRITYSVETGDVLYVAQYTGPRLPEGATELPEGAAIRFYRIDRVYNDPGSGCGYTAAF